jgi:CubicO group peptidase (beta-lactamase class C family)
MRQILSIAVILVGALTSAHAADLDAKLKAELARQRVPALSVVVVRHGKIVKLSSYGVANVEWQAAATNQTRYEIASMSKMYIGLAVRMLADEGKLDVEDLVSKYLPDVPEGFQKMRIRHLLTMSTGLPEDWGGPLIPYDEDVGTVFDDASMLRAFGWLESAAPLGFEFHYSGPGYAMLGMIVTRITGAPFTRFVEERIFRPAGMKSSSYLEPWTIVPQRAQGYRLDHDKLVLGRHVASYLHARADVGILSTAEDLASFVIALQNGKLVKDPERLWQPVVSDAGHALDYDYGWMTGIRDGRRARFHPGGYRTGFTTITVVLPDDDLTVVALTNGNFSSADRFAKIVIDDFLTDAWPAARPLGSADEARLLVALQGLGKGTVDPEVFSPDALEPNSLAEVTKALRNVKAWKIEARYDLAKRPASIHGHSLVAFLVARSESIGLQLYQDASGKIVYVAPIH